MHILTTHNNTQVANMLYLSRSRNLNVEEMQNELTDSQVWEYQTEIIHFYFFTLQYLVVASFFKGIVNAFV